MYQQREFYRRDGLLTDAPSRTAPENIVRIPWNGGFRYRVIETKGSHKELRKAVANAQGYFNRIDKLKDSERVARLPAS